MTGLKWTVVVAGFAGMLAVGGPAQASQAAGTVTGIVTTSARNPRPLRVTIDQGVCGRELPDESIVVNGSGGLKNAVVILTGVTRSAAPGQPSILNEHCRFVPRVQVVMPETSVETSSKDPVLHTTNASGPDGTTIFNVGLPVPGMRIARSVGGEGIVRISCNTHPWMRGWVVVTNEMAAVTDADGRFTITGVPPGSYELRIWHETLKGAPQKVTVTAGGTADVAFTVD